MWLAIDTSNQWCGLALVKESRLLGEMTWLSVNHHTVELAPTLALLLNRCGCDLKTLQGIAIARGPGSFTSLRVGMAFAKGIALACHAPLFGVPTLDILAYTLPKQDLPLLVALQAGRGRLASAYYQWEKDQWQSTQEAKVSSLDEIAQSIDKPTLICGEFDDEQRKVLSRLRKLVILASPSQSYRRPSVLAEIARKRYQDTKIDPLTTQLPIYLHTNEVLSASFPVETPPA